MVFACLRESFLVPFLGPRHCARGERGEGRERGVFWKMHLENAMTKVWDSMRWDEQICRYRMIQDTGRLYRVEMIHKIRLKSYQIMFNVLFSPLLRPRFCKTKHSVFSTSPASPGVCNRVTEGPHLSKLPLLDSPQHLGRISLRNHLASDPKHPKHGIMVLFYGHLCSPYHPAISPKIHKENKAT